MALKDHFFSSYTFQAFVQCSLFSKRIKRSHTNIYGKFPQASCFCFRFDAKIFISDRCSSLQLFYHFSSSKTIVVLAHFVHDACFSSVLLQKYPLLHQHTTLNQICTAANIIDSTFVTAEGRIGFGSEYTRIPLILCMNSEFT